MNMQKLTGAWKYLDDCLISEAESYRPATYKRKTQRIHPSRQENQLNTEPGFIVPKANSGRGGNPRKLKTADGWREETNSRRSLTDQNKKAERSTLVIMAKKPSSVWKRSLLIAAEALVVVGLAGAAVFALLRLRNGSAPQPAASLGTHEPVTVYTLPDHETSSFTESSAPVEFKNETEDLPTEVVAALQARECRSFWVGDSNQVVQAWSFTPISGYELWPEARELLFADAEERKPVWHYRDPTGEGNDADIYYLHTDGLNLCVVASSTSLSVSRDEHESTQWEDYVIPMELTKTYYEKLCALLQQKAGLSMTPMSVKRACFASTFVVGGLPVDSMSDLDHCCGLISIPLLDGTYGVSVSHPITDIRSEGSKPLNGPCTEEEVRQLISQHDAEGNYGEDCAVVTVYRECSFHYVMDYQENRIIPVWDVNGTRYFDYYDRDPDALYTNAWNVHYVVNAATGEIGIG